MPGAERTADCLQRPLRSRFRQQLKAGVRQQQCRLTGEKYLTSHARMSVQLHRGRVPMRLRRLTASAYTEHGLVHRCSCCLWSQGHALVTVAIPWINRFFTKGEARWISPARSPGLDTPRLHCPGRAARLPTGDMQLACALPDVLDDPRPRRAGRPTAFSLAQACSCRVCAMSLSMPPPLPRSLR